MAVTGVVITYLKNGVLFYSSNRSPVSTLYFDSSPYNTGATIQDVTSSTGWT